MISPLAAIAANLTVPSGPEAFSEYWFPGGAISDEVGLFLYADFFSRALGMMLIGVAFYRLGIITGERPRRFYIRMAVAGIGIGLPLAALGLALTIANDFSYESALLSTIPNTLATIPAVLGYVAVVSLWNSRGETRLHGKIRAAGRMALTNYLSQTVIGVAILRGLFDPQDLTRTWIVVFVICVWALQLWWSEAWLARFRYGPAEWAWRSATYRRWQPLRL